MHSREESVSSVWKSLNKIFAFLKKFHTKDFDENLITIADRWIDISGEKR